MSQFQGHKTPSSFSLQSLVYNPQLSCNQLLHSVPHPLTTTTLTSAAASVKRRTIQLPSAINTRAQVGSVILHPPLVYPKIITKSIWMIVLELLLFSIMSGEIQTFRWDKFLPYAGWNKLIIWCVIVGRLQETLAGEEKKSRTILGANRMAHTKGKDKNAIKEPQCFRPS